MSNVLSQAAMQDFQSMLGNTPVAQEIVDLWQEYEDAKTPEALLVKDLDKFEMIVQALEYEKCKYKLTYNLPYTHISCVADKKSLQSFFDSTQGKFQHPTIKAWAEALYAERRLL